MPFLNGLTPFQLANFRGMTVATAVLEFDIFERTILIMKTLASFLLGGALLFGAATLGLPSASANARERHDKNYWRHHHRQHRHHHTRRNKLSY